MTDEDIKKFKKIAKDILQAGLKIRDKLYPDFKEDVDAHFDFWNMNNIEFVFTQKSRCCYGKEKRIEINFNDIIEDNIDKYISNIKISNKK